MLEAINMLAAVSVAIATPGAGLATAPARRFHARVGNCSVTSLAQSRRDPVDDGAPRVSSNTFLVEAGGRTMLVAPIDLTREDRTSRGTPDAVILTSLAQEQLHGVMDGERPAFPQSNIYVDRALVDGAREPGSEGSAARSVLAAYQAIGKLRIAEPDAQPMPGVTIAISPDRQRSESRVRIACGPTTLMLLPGREMVFAPTPIGARRRDDLARTLASDAYAVAVTDGRFPGIGRVYAEHDGYHWGSVEARSFRGAPRVRGEVTVELAGASVTPEQNDGRAARPTRACDGPVPCQLDTLDVGVSPK